MANEQDSEVKMRKLLSCYVRAGDDGLLGDCIMLCEMVGEEMQTVSLRLAADAMTKFNNGEEE